MPATECPECDGTGTLTTLRGWTRYYERCPRCDGSGVIDDGTDDDTTEKEPTE
jgi:DnaJ-class molecular chaperone